jgi:predicted nuclease with TOPRIM domain
MAELDNIPQKQSIEFETIKLDETIISEVTQLTQKSNLLINDFGQIYIRKKQITDEIEKLNELLEKAESEYKTTQIRLNEIGDGLDDKYPQARIDLQNGTVIYQPGAPTRKQQAQQANQ